MDQFITAGNVAGMVIHSFLVVLREGVETVFFFAAITHGNIGAAMQGWGGGDRNRHCRFGQLLLL